MTEIRTKDKLFLLLFVPAVVAGAYWYGWRTTAARDCAALQARESSLVAVEDHPVEKARAQRMRDAAQQELKAEQAIPMPKAKIRVQKDETLARREQAVIYTLRAAGLQIRRVESAGAGTKGGETLKATGLCPDPAARRYAITGTYPQICRALEAFAKREMAVIVDSLALSDAARNQWNLALWL